MSDTRPVVLVVDDEVQIRRFLRAGFEMEQFSVLEAENARRRPAAQRCGRSTCSSSIFGLPDLDGSEIVERVRSWSNVPIIVLSVRSSEEEKVRLLELGADDYVVKPFGMAELLARAQAALRRQSRGTGGELVQGRAARHRSCPAQCPLDGERLPLPRRNIACCRCSRSMPATSSRISIC